MSTGFCCRVDKDGKALPDQQKTFIANIESKTPAQAQKALAMFEEVATFKNIYNRLVSFDGNDFHGVNSFYTKGVPRLTQYFFVNKIEMHTQTPLDRMRKYGNFKI